VDIKSFSSYLQILDSDRRNTHAILLPCFFVTDIEVLPCDSERGLKSHPKDAWNWPKTDLQLYSQIVRIGWRPVLQIGWPGQVWKPGGQVWKLGITNWVTWLGMSLMQLSKKKCMRTLNMTCKPCCVKGATVILDCFKVIYLITRPASMLSHTPCSVGV